MCSYKKFFWFQVPLMYWRTVFSGSFGQGLCRLSLFENVFFFFFILTFSLSVFGWLWALLGCGGISFFLSTGPGSFISHFGISTSYSVKSPHSHKAHWDWNLPHNLSFSAQNLQEKTNFPLAERAAFLILLSLWVGGVSALWRAPQF